MWQDACKRSCRHKLLSYRICIVIYGIARDDARVTIIVDYCGLFDKLERTVLVKDCA